MKINLSELREISENIFEHIRQSGIDEVEISVDYYWDIPNAYRFNVYDPPSPDTLTIGQLENDWGQLQKLISNNATEPIAYHLVWLSSILKAIGEKIIS